MRLIPLLILFVLIYIEFSLFVVVANYVGVLITLFLALFTSVVGVSLVRNQGFKTIIQMQQRMANGENPANEMIRSVSLVMAGFLLLIPGFFTDFLGLLLLLPATQYLLSIKLLPYLNVRYANRNSTGQWQDSNTFEGEYQRKNDGSTAGHHLEDQEKKRDD